jgi:AraC-like DNA-binding protein
MTKRGSMKALPLVRVAMVLPVVTFLERSGAPVQRYLERAAIPPAVLAFPEALIPLHQVGLFLEDAARAEGLPDLGMIAAGHVSTTALGALGEVLRGALTVGEMLRDAVRLHPSYASGGRVWLEHEKGRVWLRHANDRRIEIGRSIDAQLSFVIMLRLLRAVLGPTWRPLEIHLPSDHAPTLTELDLPADVPVKTGCASVGIALSRASLASPVAPAWRTATPVDSLRRQMLDSSPAVDFPGSVRQAVGTLLRGGYPSIGRTAEAIGMSIRTLQRRLGESRVSYSRLVEKERFEHALALLADRGVKITEIAFALGYSDVANFTHAFHRWTGLAPREFRRRG